MGLLSLVKQKLAAIKNAPDYSRTGLLKNTIKGLPTAAKTTAKEIATGAVRFPVSTGEAVGRIVTGNKNVVLPAKKVPGLGILNPVQSYQSQAQQEINSGSSLKKAIGKVAFNAATDEPVGVAFKPIALVGGLLGKSYGKIFKTLAKETEASQVFSILRKNFGRLDKNIATEIAPRIAKMTDEKTIEKYVNKKISDQYKMGSLNRNHSATSPSGKNPLDYPKNQPIQRNPLAGSGKSAPQQGPQGPNIKQSLTSRSLPTNTTQAGKKLGTAQKLITSGKKILEESGASGKKMANIMDNQRVKEDLLTGNYNVRIKKALSGLSKEERFNVTDTLEGGKPLNAKVAKATSELRTWLDEVATKAEKDQFTMKTPGGGSVPFTRRDAYFPRQYNLDDLAKGKKRDQALEHLVKTGQARNLAEAEQKIQMMIDNAQRRAGNLENPRMLDLPGYEKDPLKALPRYAQSVAKRFTEAEHFGKNDEVVADLIKQITNEGGDWREAQRIFDFTVDGVPKNKVVSAIQQFNVATKLSLSAITNASQSVNTMTKAGVLNTLRAGLWKGWTKEGKELAELVNAYDDFIYVREGGFEPAKVVKGVMYIFKKVENFNRRTAANAGAYKYQSLVKKLQNDPESKYAVRQLESLGIDIEKTLKGELTDDDLLTAANKMIEKTQFKVDPLDVPPSWKTPLGRLLTQFKSFSFMQTKFVRDEILKEARHGNFVPMATFIPTAVAASLLMNKVRNKLTGREDENIDIRDWDKWMKGIGTIPTDLLIQADFLKDTFEADYITPLEKSSRVAGTFFGPTMGEAGKLASGLEQIPRIQEKNKRKIESQKQDPYLNLERQAVEKVPFAGQYLKNKYFGYPKSTKTQAEKDEASKIYDLYDQQQLNSLNRKEQAIKIDKELSTMGGDEANKRLQELAKTDPKLFEKVIDVAQERALNLTPNEKLIKELNNPEKAKYIDQKIMELPPEKRNAYVVELIKKKILTEDALVELAKIVQERQKQ